MGQLSVGVAMKLKDIRQPVQVTDRFGVSFPRYFTAKLEPGKTPYDDANWELRTASIGNDKGAVIFEQRDVKSPLIGPRRPQTSSSASISTAKSVRRSAKPVSASS